MSTGRIVLLVVVGLAAVLTILILIARRRALRKEAQRRQDLTTQGMALGLSFVGDDPALAAALGDPPILPPQQRHLFNMLRGTRRGHAVTVFDYTWLVHTKEHPRWNVESTGDTNFPILTCALTVVVIEAGAKLPSFLLQPNETARFRAGAERAAAMLGDQQSGVLGAIVKAAGSVAHAIPDQPGLHFPERPAFYEQYSLTADDEPRIRALFNEKLLDALLSRPGWIVNAANGRLFMSVLLSCWPPTRMERYHVDTVRLLSPEHLQALVDGALDVAELLDSAARG